MTTLGQILNEFYIEEGLWARNPTLTPEKLKATELVTDEYPILSDFVMYVEDYQDKLQSKKHTNKIELSSVNRIYNTFNELLTTNADMFEGTTEVQDISKPCQTC